MVDADDVVTHIDRVCTLASTDRLAVFGLGRTPEFRYGPHSDRKQLRNRVVRERRSGYQAEPVSCPFGDQGRIADGASERGSLSWWRSQERRKAESGPATGKSASGNVLLVVLGAGECFLRHSSFQKKNVFCLSLLYTLGCDRTTDVEAVDVVVRSGRFGWSAC